MDGLKEVKNLQQFQTFETSQTASYGTSTSDETVPGSGFGNHSNQYICSDPEKSVWSFGLYSTIQEDLNLKSWPHFESCKKIWEKAEVRPKVDRGIFTSFADVVRKRDDAGTGRDRGDSNYMSSSSSRGTNQDRLYLKHQEHSLRRSVKATTTRSKRVPPCLFQYDDPISEELSLSLEPISSSSSHFSSDCDGENNDGIHNGNSSLIPKADREFTLGERKKPPIFHPRMSTPAGNSGILSKRRYPPSSCHFPYEDSYLEDLSLEPVSSSSSHFSDVDLELSEIAYLHSRISTISYAQTPPSTTSQDGTFRSNVAQMRVPSAQQNNVSPRLHSLTKDMSLLGKEKVIFPSAEFPTLASVSNSVAVKTPDSGKIPKLMEIELDMKDELVTSPPKGETLENGVQNSSLPAEMYDETQDTSRITNGEKVD